MPRSITSIIRFLNIQTSGEIIQLTIEVGNQHVAVDLNMAQRTQFDNLILSFICPALEEKIDSLIESFTEALAQARQSSQARTDPMLSNISLAGIGLGDEGSNSAGRPPEHLNPPARRPPARRIRAEEVTEVVDSAPYQVDNGDFENF